MTITHDWLTRHQAAAYLQVTPQTIDHYIKKKIIVGCKIGRRVRISASSIEKAFEKATLMGQKTA